MIDHIVSAAVAAFMCNSWNLLDVCYLKTSGKNVVGIKFMLYC